MECHHEAAIKPCRINCCAAARTKTLLSELHPDAIAMSSANATMKVTSAFGLRERNRVMYSSANDSCGILVIPCRSSRVAISLAEWSNSSQRAFRHLSLCRGCRYPCAFVTHVSTSSVCAHDWLLRHRLSLLLVLPNQRKQRPGVVQLHRRRTSAKQCGPMTLPGCHQTRGRLPSAFTVCATQQPR